MKSESAKIRSLADSASRVLVTESPAEINRIITEIEKKNLEKFKKESDDLTMAYAKLSGVFMSFLQTTLIRLQQTSPEEYKDLVNNILK